MKDTRAYRLGREARREGKPCALVDGRFSLENRAEWFRGWNEEERFRLQLSATEAQAQEARTVVSKLKQFAATL